MIHGMISVLVAAVLAALLATQGAAAQAILLKVPASLQATAVPADRVMRRCWSKRGIITRIGRQGRHRPAGGRTRGVGPRRQDRHAGDHQHACASRSFQKGLTYLAENFARETIMDDLNRERYFGISTAMSLGIERGDVMFQIRADQAEGRAGGAQLLLAGRGIGAPGAGPGTRSMQTSPMR